MNQVNPLHIGALFLVILAYLFFLLNGAKVELQEAKQSYYESETLAVNLRALKDNYANTNHAKSALQRVLSQRALKGAALEIKSTKKSTKIASKSIDTAALNALMGKVLNGSYNITALKIKKLSETNAAFDMEIKW